MGDLRNQIGNLSAADKFELLDALWESLEEDAQPTDAQCAELDYRMVLHERDRDCVVPWEQVRAGLFKKQ